MVGLRELGTLTGVATLIFMVSTYIYERMVVPRAVEERLRQRFENKSLTAEGARLSFQLIHARKAETFLKRLTEYARLRPSGKVVTELKLATGTETELWSREEFEAYCERQGTEADYTISEDSAGNLVVKVEVESMRTNEVHDFLRGLDQLLGESEKHTSN